MTEYESLKTQKAKVTFIRTQLQESDAWLKRGILAIYKRQTADEQATDDVKHDNGMGFTGVNAPFLSSIAKQILAGRELSQKQVAASRRSMLKYSGQLMKIAEGKI
jgi:hypothetical protein